MSVNLSIALFAGLLPILLVGCSRRGNEAGVGGGDLFIETCSLGCTGGNDGTAVSCTIVNTYRNQEITVLFSVPVDESTVNASSFRVVDVANGTTPIGEFFVDQLNPRRLVFRPELSFGSDGVPHFGFKPFTTYEITIPGEAQGDAGPFILSRKGRRNQSRLQCTIFTSEGIIDPVPGSPRVTMLVETVNDSAPVTPVRSAAVTSGSVRVKTKSPIRMVFDDIMYVASLLDPRTGQSTTVTVEVDADGQLGSSEDRDRVAGSFDVEVDLESLQTILTFEHQVRVASEAAPQPTSGFPSAGTALSLRRIVVNIPTNVVDLVTNSLEEEDGGGLSSFIPETTAFVPLILPGLVEDTGAPFEVGAGAEDFTFSNSDYTPPDINNPDEVSNEDASRSGAIWGNGALVAGLGGGSGRLGDLVISGGETITLDTDSQDFPLDGELPDIIGNEVYSMGVPTGAYLEGITITDGTFEFNRVEIQTGGTLIFEGSQPARLFSKGRMIIANGARIDISGANAGAHDSAQSDPTLDWDGTGGDENFYLGADFAAEVPAEGGPGGGAGGLGGTRFNNGGAGVLNTFTGFLLPTAFRGGWLTEDMDGELGEGIGGADPDAIPAVDGQGIGGVHWPETFPTGVQAFNNNPGNDTEGLNWTRAPHEGLPGGTLGCFSKQVGGTGGGGSYGTPGSGGEGLSDRPVPDAAPDGDFTNLPTPQTSGGSIPDRVANDPNVGQLNYLSTGYSFRELRYSPSSPPGNLLGGAGGGGGGNHPYRTYSTSVGGLCGILGTNVTNFPDGFSGPYPGWTDHSGASGGGGGGAFQAVSGDRISLNGVIDASGGNGGSAVTFPSLQYAGGLNATPGGGGSGGAVRMQARSVDIADQAGRIDVSGGQGGVSSNLWGGSFGGTGGAGLVRIETEFGGPPDAAGAHHNEVDQKILPYDSVNGNTTAGQYGKYSLDFLSIEKGGWEADTRYRPASYSAATSCWIQPAGNFYSLNFAEDETGSTDPDEMGWNMNIIYEFNGTTQRVPFRGINSTTFESLEDIWGNCLNHGNETGAGGNCNGGTQTSGSPVIVRFQGARVASAPGDLCDLGIGLPIDPASITPWVKHPSELNPDAALGRDWDQPNLMRFTVIFDNATLGGGLPAAIQGVDDLWVRVDPD